MKILAAFDSFKESMSAYDAGEAVKKAALGHEVIIKQLADGGEGTMAALNSALHGTVHQVRVTGPLFDAVDARVAIIDDFAVVEAAQACGLDLVARDERNGSLTTTKGVGEMIRYAIHSGVSKVLVTLGGSSTNDGGVGMLSSLGVQFLDAEGENIIPNGHSLHRIEKIDMSQCILNNKEVEIIGLCDVSNPLLGKNGATYIYGPQKGIGEDRLSRCDTKMMHYATLSAEVLGKDYSEVPGAGAAGGLGFAIIAYLKGKLVPGFEEIAQLVDLEKEIENCDLVFTGEGKMDRQTLMGKVPQGVLKLALKHHKKVVAFAGKVEDREILLKAGFDDVRVINHDVQPIEILLKQGSSRLEEEVKSYLKENNICM